MSKARALIERMMHLNAVLEAKGVHVPDDRLVIPKMALLMLDMLEAVADIGIALPILCRLEDLAEAVELKDAATGQ